MFKMKHLFKIFAIVMATMMVVSCKEGEQAAEFGHSFERECAFLTVHSTLHLLGYDHETSEADDQDMRKRQSAIVTAMGLGV